MQFGEGSELLGDQQRGMVRQHDPAGSDPDRRRVGGDVGDQHRRRRRCDAAHVVMLRIPDSPIAGGLDRLSELHAAVERVGDAGITVDGGEIEDGETESHGLWSFPKRWRVMRFASSVSTSVEPYPAADTLARFTRWRRGGGPNRDGFGWLGACSSPVAWSVWHADSDGFGRSVELGVVQIGVGATGSEQFVAIAMFDDATLLHDEDRVGVADRGEAMGDDEAGSFLSK